MSSLPLAHVLVAPERPDCAADDWVALLDAVRERLTRLSGVPAEDRQSQAALQECVSDCLLALDLVHEELRRAIEHRRHLEQQLLAARRGG